MYILSERWTEHLQNLFLSLQDKQKKKKKKWNYTEEVRSPNSDKDLTNRFSDSLIKLMRHHQHCITASLLGNTEALQQRMYKVLHEDIVFLQGLHVKGETH